MFESDLVSKCRRNDRKAQMQLYKQYCNGMFCVAMRFLKNNTDAEDAVQESFIKAFQKLEQFKGDVSFGAWLKKIVVNRCLDTIKLRKAEYAELNEIHLKVVDDDDWTVDDGVTIHQVKEAIHRLPEKYRNVVQLYLVEGYDHSEISGILNLNENNCRTRLMRGKGHLKEFLKPALKGLSR